MPGTEVNIAIGGKMAKVFCLMEKSLVLGGRDYKRIELLSTTNEQLRIYRDNGWRIIMPPFLVEQDGGDDVDLREIYGRLDALDSAIDVIGQTHNHLWNAIDELREGDGIVPTEEIAFEVWGAVDDGECKITKPSSIKDKYAVVAHNTLAARFTIDEGTTLTDGVLYIVPEVKPTYRYPHLFNGTFVHNCEKSGWMAHGVARWHRRTEFGWGIRMQYNTFCVPRAFLEPHNEQYLMYGGAWYAQGRSGKPLTAFGGDCFEVTIPLP